MRTCHVEKRGFYKSFWKTKLNWTIRTQRVRKTERTRTPRASDVGRCDRYQDGGGRAAIAVSSWRVICPGNGDHRVGKCPKARGAKIRTPPSIEIVPVVITTRPRAETRNRYGRLDETVPDAYAPWQRTGASSEVLPRSDRKEWNVCSSWDTSKSDCHLFSDTVDGRVGFERLRLQRNKRSRKLLWTRTRPTNPADTPQTYKLKSVRVLPSVTDKRPEACLLSRAFLRLVACWRDLAAAIVADRCAR